MKIGSKLHSLRKSKGLSLKELSSLADISISFLSDIENEKSNPSLDRLKQLADILEVPISYFLVEQSGDSVDSLISDEELLPVLNLLRDYRKWNTEDKQELYYYLKAKKVLRDKE